MSDSSCFMPFDPSSDARAIKTPFIQDSVRRLAIELGFEAYTNPLLSIVCAQTQIEWRGNQEP